MRNSLEIPLKLDLDPFEEGLKTSLRMGRKYKENFEAVLGDVDVDVAEERFERQLKELGREYKETVRKIESDEIDIGVDTKKAKTKTKALQKNAKGGRSSLIGLETAAYGAGAALTTGFAMAAGQAIRVGSDFESTMSNLAAISGATEEQLAQLEETAKRLGATTGQYTAKEVGKLQVQFSKKGFSPEQIDEVTKSTLALAAATGEDLASSAETAAGVLNSYGYEAEETARITDVMTSSFSNSALNLRRYRDAMTNAGKASSDAGLEVEETTAIIGELVNSNIKASTSGRGLRNILLELGRESSEVSKILGGSIDNFQDLIDRLQVAADNSDKFTKAQEQLGDRNAIVFSTMVDNIQEIQKASNKYYNSAGTAMEKMRTQMNNFRGDTLELKSAVEALGIKTFEGIKDELRGAAQWATKLVRRLQETELETTIRQLRNIGIEEEVLKGLRQTQNLNEALQKIDKSGEDIRDTLIKTDKTLGKDILKKINVWGAKYEENANLMAEKIDVSKIKIEDLKKAHEDLIAKTAKIIDKNDGELTPELQEQKNTAVEKANILTSLIEKVQKYQRYQKTLGKLKEDEKKSFDDILKTQKSSIDKRRKGHNIIKRTIPLIETKSDLIGEIPEKIQKANEQFQNMKMEYDASIGITTPNLPESDIDMSGLSVAQDKVQKIKQQEKEATDYVMQNNIQQWTTDMIEGMDQANDATSQWAQKHRDTFDAIDTTVGKVQGLYEQLYQYRITQIQNAKEERIRAAQEEYQARRREIKRTIANEEKRRNKLAQLEQTHQARISNIKEEARQKELKAKKKMRGIKIAQAISNTALGVTKALATLPPPASFIAAAATAATGAAKVATIQAQEYAAGGLVQGPEQIVKINERGEEYILDHETTRKIGAQTLAKVQQNPEQARTALDAVSGSGSPMPTPSYAFQSGGSTRNVSKTNIQKTNINNQSGGDISQVVDKLDDVENAIKGLELLAEFDREELALLVRVGENELQRREVE